MNRPQQMSADPEEILHHAKAMEPAAGSSPSMSMSPTLTTPAMTRDGMILGTASYMSPEQAHGKTVDKRADIWAFGCVLFEMLTGARAFRGQTVTDVLAAVIEREPEWPPCASSSSGCRSRVVVERTAVWFSCAWPTSGALAGRDTRRL